MPGATTVPGITIQGVKMYSFKDFIIAAAFWAIIFVGGSLLSFLVM